MVEQCYQKFLNNNAYPRTLTAYELLNDYSTVYVSSNGKKLINFSSSDYLGLARHPFLIQRSQQFAEQYGVGSTASRLVTGNLSLYNALEKQLAVAIGKPAALILATGFQANTSVLSALFDPAVLEQEPLIFADKLAHVSLLLGAQSSGRLQRFQHNDLTHLEMLLIKHAHCSQPKWIIVESVYSMEGDCANLAELIVLAKKYGAMLYVDDAHAVGVYGWGKTVPYAADIDIVMGTFSKALGSFGGYIACSETIKAYLVNRCKGLIYSTGLPPTVLGAMSAALELLPQLENEQKKVLAHAKKIRDFFRKEGLAYGQSETHIVPWIIGDAEKTCYISQQLANEGILATTIRPPSVPIGKSRIRFCLSAAHSEQDLDFLISSIEKIKKKI